MVSKRKDQDDFKNLHEDLNIYYSEIYKVRENKVSTLFEALHIEEKAWFLVKCANKHINDANFLTFKNELSYFECLKDCPYVPTIKYHKISSKGASKIGRFTFQRYFDVAQLLSEKRHQRLQAQVKDLLIHVATALDYAYQTYSIAHINLTPQCIFYSQDERKFLIGDWEFGVIETGRNSLVFHENTKTSTEIQTLFFRTLSSDKEFLAPEIASSAKSRTWDTKNFHLSSSFSLACIVLEIFNIPLDKLRGIILLEKAEFNKNVSKLLSQIRVQNPTLIKLLSEMLSPDPKHRPSAKTIVTMLTEANLRTQQLISYNHVPQKGFERSEIANQNSVNTDEPSRLTDDSVNTAETNARDLTPKETGQKYQKTKGYHFQVLEDTNLDSSPADKFNEELKDGKHECAYENGDKYIGYWKEGKWHGQGKWIKSNNKSWYDGWYVNGKRHGCGKMLYENGDEYEGEWENGKKHGEGKYTWKEGGEGNFSCYDGSWENDKRQGYGKMTYKNGDKYTGNWKNDRFEGRGVYEWEDGRKYDGNFKEGLKSGKGKMIYADGDSYEGEWLEDKYHGIGIYKSGDDSVQGEFINGELIEEIN